MPKPAAVEEEVNPPPEAAIIHDNNTEGARAEKTAAMREVRWTAARQRREREPQVHHGKTNFSSEAFIVHTNLQMEMLEFLYEFGDLCFANATI